ncbi:MAG: hypothetical protein ACK5XN_35270, partial [Bacteroidota bacterium]
LNGLKNVSIERIISEIYAMAKNNKFTKAIESLNDLGISENVFGLNLNTNLQEIWSQDKKTAFVFIYFPIKKIKSLPIPKNAKMYLDVNQTKYDDVIKNYCFIWTRFHSIEKANIFLEIYNYLNKKNIEINAKEVPINYELLDLFDNKEKGKVIMLMRYFSLINVEINYENILNYINKEKSIN